MTEKKSLAKINTHPLYPIFGVIILGMISFLISIPLIILHPTEENNNSFFIGSIVWLLSSIIAGLWMNNAQRAYLRLYRKRVNPNLPLLPEEFWGENDRLTNKPWFLNGNHFALSWNLFKLAWTPQSDKDLEHARQQVTHRWWITVFIIFFGPLLHTLFSIIIH